LRRITVAIRVTPRSRLRTGIARCDGYRRTLLEVGRLSTKYLLALFDSEVFGIGQSPTGTHWWSTRAGLAWLPDIGALLSLLAPASTCSTRTSKPLKTPVIDCHPPCRRSVDLSSPATPITTPR